MGFKISGVEVPPIPEKVKTLGSQSYQIAAEDDGSFIRYTGSSSSTITIREQRNVVYADNTTISIEQSGTGQVKIVGETVAVTVTSSSSLTTSKQGSVITLKRVSSDNWVVYGDTIDNSNMAMIIALS
jgi:hypothetical protein